MKTTSITRPGVGGVVNGVNVSEEPRPKLKPLVRPPKNIPLFGYVR